MRREDNIKMDLQEVEWKGWIDILQDRDRWRALTKFGTKSVGSMKFEKFLE